MIAHALALCLAAYFSIEYLKSRSHTPPTRSAKILPCARLIVMAKRLKFDPFAQKQKYNVKKSAGGKLKHACGILNDAVSEVMLESKELPFENLSINEVELVLVSIFGLRGVSALKTAMDVVPNELSIDHQIAYIAKIVGVAVDPASKFDISNIIRSFLSHSTKVAYFDRDMKGTEVLRNASYN